MCMYVASTCVLWYVGLYVCGMLFVACTVCVVWCIHKCVLVCDYIWCVHMWHLWHVRMWCGVCVHVCIQMLGSVCMCLCVVCVFMQALENVWCVHVSVCLSVVCGMCLCVVCECRWGVCAPWKMYGGKKFADQLTSQMKMGGRRNHRALMVTVTWFFNTFGGLYEFRIERGSWSSASFSI